MTYRPHAALTMFLPLAAPETPAITQMIFSVRFLKNSR